MNTAFIIVSTIKLFCSNRLDRVSDAYNRVEPCDTSFYGQSFLDSFYPHSRLEPARKINYIYLSNLIYLSI